MPCCLDIIVSKITICEPKSTLRRGVHLAKFLSHLEKDERSDWQSDESQVTRFYQSISIKVQNGFDVEKGERNGSTTFLGIMMYGCRFHVSVIRDQKTRGIMVRMVMKMIFLPMHLHRQRIVYENPLHEYRTNCNQG